MATHQSPTPSTSRGSALARFITGRRTAWLVALVPIVLAVLVIGVVPEGEREARATDSLPESSGSTLWRRTRAEPGTEP